MSHPFIPTSQHNVKPIYPFLTVTANPFAFVNMGVKKELVSSLTPIYNPCIIIPLDGEVFFLGCANASFDGKRFRTLPTLLTIGGKEKLGKLYLAGAGFFGVYDKNLKPYKEYRDWSHVISLEYYKPDKYIGGTYEHIVIFDSNINTLAVYKTRSTCRSATTDGTHIYTVEAHKYVRKIDFNGNVKWEKMFPDLIFHVKITSDNNLIISGWDGVYIADLDGNVTKRFSVPYSMSAVEVDGYIYANSIVSYEVWKIDTATGDIVARYDCPNVQDITVTDDGNLLVTRWDYWSTKTIIELRDLDFNVLFSQDSDENPYIFNASSAVKKYGENKILVAQPGYGLIVEIDTTTGDITNFYAGLLAYDVDYYNGKYVVCQPIIGVVYIFDEDFNLVGYLTDALSPTAVCFYGGKLYVSDNYTGYVYVYDGKTFSLEGSFVPDGLVYPVFRYLFLEDGRRVACDGRVAVLYDKNGNIVLRKDIGVDYNDVVDCKPWKDKFIVIRNFLNRVYVYDKTLQIFNFDIGFWLTSFLLPSHTGGIVEAIWGANMKFYRDYSIEKTYSETGGGMTWYYPTADGTYIIVGGKPTKVIREVDSDLKSINYIELPDTFPTSCVKLSNGNYVYADARNSKVVCIKSDGTVVWEKKYETPYVINSYDYNGVWVFNWLGGVDYIDADGNVRNVISKPNWKSKGVFDDGEYLYVASYDGKINKYTRDGEYVEEIYSFDTWTTWITLMVGIKESPDKPYHVFR